MKYIKTELGQAAFKERSALFSSRQRTVFIMFDGNKTVDAVLAATIGVGAQLADVEYMLEHGFLALAEGHALQAATDAVKAAAIETAAKAFNTRLPQDRYRDAKPLATQITAKLGLRGFMLNLSVESASGFDELLALLPKIKGAAGPQACQELERALTG